MCAIETVAGITEYWVWVIIFCEQLPMEGSRTECSTKEKFLGAGVVAHSLYKHEDPAQPGMGKAGGMGQGCL